MNVTANGSGTVSFYIQGTSEEGCDYLTIYQNDSNVWSSKGTDYGSWTLLSFSVSAGTTAFKFTYHKDGSVNNDMDRYCVDYLTAPAGIGPTTSRTSDPSNKTCNSDCTLGSGTCYSGWCGDGTKQSNYEACDQGSSNSDSWSMSKHCNANCTGWAPYCGDGAVNGSEACEPGVSTRSDEKGGVCDEGGWNGSDTYWRYRYTCTSSCTWTYTMTCDW